MLMGMSTREIVDALKSPRQNPDGTPGTPIDASQATVVRDMKVIYDRWKAEQVDFKDRLTIRQQRRIDAVMATMLARAVGGDTKAAHVVIKLMEREAELAGLDAPQKVAETNLAGDALAPRHVFMVGGTEQEYLEGLAQLHAHGQSVEHGRSVLDAYEEALDFSHTDFDLEEDDG